jgi:threonylcarbamoyladenosine tRNA methylthiotransferase MtaB
MSGVIWVVSEPDKSVAFMTLGCKVNQEESAALEELFRLQGYVVKDFKDQAQVYIINTCTVTHLADRKSRQMIRRATLHHPGSVVAVVGCYAQVAAEEILAIPGVDLVMGTQERGRLVDLVEQTILEKGGPGEGTGFGLNAVHSMGHTLSFEPLPVPYPRVRTRAFLKIEDGCDQFCSYCIVPFARGPIRSLPPDQVIEDLARLIAAGCREIVLTGVHTSAYGRDLLSETGASAKTMGTVQTAAPDLTGLLRRISALPGDFRLRLSSLEPVDISHELLQLLSSTPRFCRHLHIPLQSGDDEILYLMRRPYNTEYYRTLFEQASSLMPGVAVAADVMVGFPGESDRHFENTFQFIDSLPFRDLHIFKYSPRPGTVAADLPGQMDPPVKEERSRRLLALAEKKTAVFAARFMGQTLEVLVERRALGIIDYWEGLSDNYLRVFFPAPPADLGLRGRLLPVQVTGVGEADTLTGILR